MKFIKANDRIYSLKFGLKELMAIEEFADITEQEKRDIKFYLALNEPSLTLNDVKEIISQLDGCDIDALLNEVLLESLGTSTIDSSYPLSIKEQAEELYQLAVGKIGISPLHFFDMTPHEIELAYKGYLENKELDNTLNIIARRKYNENNTEEINLFGDGWRPSTIAKRNETFSSLGI